MRNCIMIGKGGSGMRRSDLGAYLLGVALIGIGLVLLLNNARIISVDLRNLIRDYWPLLIVALGLFWVVGPDETESRKREAVEEQERLAGPDEAESSSEAQHEPGFIQEYRADQSEPGQEEPGDTGDSGCEFDTGGFKHEKKSEAGAGDDDEEGRELARRRSNVGWVIAIIGLLILGSSTGRWGLHGGHAGGVFWAIAAVLIGLVMARSSSEPGREGPTNWAVLSRIDHRQPGWVVRSTSYSAVLGNVLLDLSVARIPDSDTYLDITAVLGGVQVILPPELPVSCEGTAILGSVSAFGQSASGGLASRDFARHGSDGSRSSLRIRCRAILGSVDIR
jgi:hypothetical protein